MTAPIDELKPTHEISVDECPPHNEIIDVEATEVSEGPQPGDIFSVSEIAGEYFTREHGIRLAIQVMGEAVGKANKKAWEQVHKDHPELEGLFVAFDDDKNELKVLDPNPKPVDPSETVPTED